MMHHLFALTMEKKCQKAYLIAEFNELFITVSAAYSSLDITEVWKEVVFEPKERLKTNKQLFPMSIKKYYHVFWKKQTHTKEN